MASRHTIRNSGMAGRNELLIGAETQHEPKVRCAVFSASSESPAEPLHGPAVDHSYTDWRHFMRAYNLAHPSRPNGPKPLTLPPGT
jgi:hypothetical protein